jgi:hypothetical protein
MVTAEITQSADYDLVGEVVIDDEAPVVAPKPKRRVALRVTA